MSWGEFKIVFDSQIGTEYRKSIVELFFDKFGGDIA